MKDEPRAKMGRRRAGGYFLLLTGFLACPCHLPILAAVLGGTTFLGILLRDHVGFVLLASGLYFFGAFFLGLKVLQREGDAPIDQRGERPTPQIQPMAARPQIIP
jgi:hypothetical protein